METVQRDTGLQCLALLLRFHQVSVDPAQIAHQFPGGPIGVPEMLRCSKDLKLKAREVTESWAGLMKLPLPAIVELKDGSFLIVGKVTEDDAVVQNPSENRPQIIKRAEFEYDWTGRVVLMTRRASLADVAAVRHHLVSAGDAQISPPARRSADRLVFSAAFCAGYAAILPGRH